MSATSRSAHGTIPVYGGNGITGFHNEATHNQPTLVIGRVGVYCGCVHLTEPQAWITDNALAVSILSDRVLQDFLFWGLKLANLNQYASQSAQPLVSGGRIYPVKFFLPPLDLQRRFSVIVKNFSNLQDKVGISLQTIKSLEVSLTSQLFSLKGSKSQFSSKQEVAHAL
jgi:type I restriction enzyme S subunit